MSERFVHIAVGGESEQILERAAAEAYAAGALGLEERPGLELVLYAREADAAAVREAVLGLGETGLSVGRAEALDATDWSTAWRGGLEPIVVSSRLLVRPSFTEHTPEAGQAVLVIDPGQAFGTGGHATTRLALELVCALPSAQLAGARVLDVGTGTGVLALAALALGAGGAVGCDTDPLGSEAARENARINRLDDRLAVYTGSVDALSPAGFDLTLANMIRSELMPLLAGLTAATRLGGDVIFSGLLAEERSRFEAAVIGHGLELVEVRAERDATGDRWLACRARRNA
jgi:ribosomal protein L11 methyltransferase